MEIQIGTWSLIFILREVVIEDVVAFQVLVLRKLVYKVVKVFGRRAKLDSGQIIDCRMIALASGQK